MCKRHLAEHIARQLQKNSSIELKEYIDLALCAAAVLEGRSAPGSDEAGKWHVSAGSRALFGDFVHRTSAANMHT